MCTNNCKQMEQSIEDIQMDQLMDGTKALLQIWGSSVHQSQRWTTCSALIASKTSERAPQLEKLAQCVMPTRIKTNKRQQAFSPMEPTCQPSLSLRRRSHQRARMCWSKPYRSSYSKVYHLIQLLATKNCYRIKFLFRIWIILLCRQIYFRNRNWQKQELLAPRIDHKHLEHSARAIPSISSANSIDSRQRISTWGPRAGHRPIRPMQEDFLPRRIHMGCADLIFQMLSLHQTITYRITSNKVELLQAV